MVYDPIAETLNTISGEDRIEPEPARVPRPQIRRADVERWAEHSLAAQAQEDGFDRSDPAVVDMLTSFVSEVTVPGEGSPVAMRCDASGKEFYSRGTAAWVRSALVNRHARQ